MNNNVLNTITSLILLFFSSYALANNCPDVDDLNDLNQLISEYKAKLEFVRAGYQENRSGYPNKAEILEQEIAALASARDGMQEAIVECRKRGVVGGTSTKPLVAACPDCYDKQAAYEQSRQRYAATRSRLESFIEQYRLQNISALKAAYEELIATQKKLARARLIYRGLSDDKDRADAYKSEVLLPLLIELELLQELVPNDGQGFNGPNTAADAGAMLSKLKALQGESDDATFARDQVLKALVNCNLTLCGSASKSANELFMPGGLYGPAAGSPGWNGETNDLTAIGGNSHASSGQPMRNIPSNSGALMEPDFGSFMVPDEVVIDIPKVPDDTQEKLSQLATNNSDNIPPQPCELRPPQLCQNLDAAVQEECVVRFTRNNRLCKQYQEQMLNASPYAGCNQVCDFTELSRLDGLWLLEKILGTIDQRVTSELDSAAAIEKATLRDQLEKLQREQTILKNVPESREHHVYKNTDAQSTFKHFGSYFEPTPPLVYVGKEKGQRTEQEDRRLQQIPKLIFEIQMDIKSTTLADTRLVEWALQAKTMWQDLMPCQRAQVTERYAMCRASCQVALADRNDNYRWSSTFCDPAGVIGFSHASKSKIWMFPPKN